MKAEVYKKLLKDYISANDFASDQEAYKKYEKKTVDQHVHLCIAIRMFMKYEGILEQFLMDTKKSEYRQEAKLYKIQFKSKLFTRDHTDVFTNKGFATQSGILEIENFKKVMKEKGEDIKDLGEVTFQVLEYHP